MLHAYSLVHDDLPAMDDDDLRRGKPSTHKAFDEATAILAGDALQARAFEVLAEPDTHSDPQARCELVAALGAAAGARGMAGGQMIDMLAEGRTLDGPAVTRLQALKTGRLIQFSAEAGAILGRAPQPQRHLLAAYGRDLGAAFQIADDLLDAEGSTEETGKTAGKDAAAGKATMVAVLGTERARSQAEMLARQAAGHLDSFGERAGAAAGAGGLRRDTAELNFGARSKMSPVKTPLLDRVRFPADLRNFSPEQLRQVADELRAETIDAVSVTGGHLGASLGVVELTVAIHAIFDTPHDRLIWDVGHQAYPHKILTGRRDRIRTLRQGGGLSGFTRRAESEYDPFGAAHSSTSISAGLGMAVARDLKGEERNVIAVIGDGAMSAGMAYEAMNNAGARHSRLIVVLNDNDMSIAPPVGAMSAYLSRLMSSHSFLSLRELGARMAKRFPRGIERTARRAEEYARGMLTGGTLFEELGFYYVGPIDGHNLDHLLPVLRNVREAEETGPILVHAITKKGKGYAAGRGLGRQAAQRVEVQRDHRRAGQGAAGAAVLYQGVRQCADRRGGARSRHRGDHRGDAVGHRAGPRSASGSRSGPSTWGSPSSTR